MYLYGRGSPRRGSRKVSVGRSSPRRGSRKRDLRLTEHTKTHNTKTRCRDIPGKQQYAVKVVPLDQIQFKYETPEILRSIFSTDSCLQSDNGVSTSNMHHDWSVPASCIHSLHAQVNFHARYASLSDMYVSPSFVRSWHEIRTSPGSF